MKTLPLGTHYHARGLDQIARANSLEILVRRRKWAKSCNFITPFEHNQRKQIRDGVWRPVIAFILFIIWGSMLIISVCDYLGVK